MARGIGDRMAYHRAAVAGSTIIVRANTSSIVDVQLVFA